MSYSITGTAYLVIFLALSYLIYRFLRFFKRKGTSVSKLLFFLLSPIWIFVLIRAIGGLFFADNTGFLKSTIGLGAFLEAISFAVGAYLIFYIKFPRISPWFATTAVLILGGITVILTINAPFQPFLENSGAINWGTANVDLLLPVLRFLLFTSVFLPLIIITFQNLKISIDPELKDNAIKLMLILFLGLVVVFFDFIVVNILKMDPIWRDFSLISFGLIYLLSIFISKKLIFPQNNKKQ